MSVLGLIRQQIACDLLRFASQEGSVALIRWEAPRCRQHLVWKPSKWSSSVCCSAEDVLVSFRFSFSCVRNGRYLMFSAHAPAPSRAMHEFTRCEDQRLSLIGSVFWAPPAVSLVASRDALIGFFRAEARRAVQTAAWTGTKTRRRSTVPDSRLRRRSTSLTSSASRRLRRRVKRAPRVCAGARPSASRSANTARRAPRASMPPPRFSGSARRTRANQQKRRSVIHIVHAMALSTISQAPAVDAAWRHCCVGRTVEGRLCSGTVLSVMLRPPKRTCCIVHSAKYLVRVVSLFGSWGKVA